MKKFIIILIKVIVFFIGWAVLVSLTPIPNSTHPAIWRLWAELIPLLGIIVFTIIFVLIEKKELSIPIFKHPLKNTAIGIGTGITWFGLVLFIMLRIGAMEIESINNVTYIAIWILAAFLNVIMQEFLFRGYMYQLIKTKYNLTVAVVFTTALFTAMHAGAFEAGIIPVLNVITMSLFVTAVLEYTGTLWAPILVHSVWNILGAIVFGGIAIANDYPSIFNSTFSDNTLLSGGLVKMEGSIIVLILNVILIVLFTVLNIKQTKLNKSL